MNSISGLSVTRHLILLNKVQLMVHKYSNTISMEDSTNYGKLSLFKNERDRVEEFKLIKVSN